MPARSNSIKQQAETADFVMNGRYTPTDFVNFQHPGIFDEHCINPDVKNSFYRTIRP